MSQLHVMIVEDELIIALHLELLLEEMGHDVCAMASDADHALSEAETHRPDVALMDLRLARGTSGVDAARRLYQEHGIRCIVLSANLDEETRRAMRPYQPIAFLGKPVIGPALARAVHEAEFQLEDNGQSSH